MVLSKGKKIILIAVAVVIILAAGCFALEAHSQTQSNINWAIRSLLDEDAASYDRDPYDPESVSAFIITPWNSVKDKSSFQRELADKLDTEILALTLQNAKAESSERAENQYGSTPLPGSTNELLCKLMVFLDQVNYEDEGLKERILGYYQGLAELERAADPDLTEAKQELGVASGLTDALEGAAEFNQAAGDFYQLQMDSIATAEEIIQHYDRAIQLSQDAGDRETFAQALSAATSSPVLEGQSFVDSGEIVDFLMEDGGELYILRSGIGGYYDTVQIYEPGEITYYGDFAVRVTTSGGGQYDMSEMSPEIWAALTPGQREEITSGNRVDTNYYYYLRGEEYDGDLIPTLSDMGYDYIYLNPDGSSLYFQGTSIAYVSNADFGEDAIYGDFSELMEEIKTSQVAVGDLIQDAVSAVALGDAESAVKSFQALSDNGTDLAAISRFCSELARNGVLDIGIDMTFGYLRLSDEEMIQLEMLLYDLQ